MTYCESEVTQGVQIRQSNHKKITLLEGIGGEGYKYSLQKPYLKEVNEFLTDCEATTSPEELKKQCSRIIFLTEDVYVARQAYLALIQGVRELRSSSYPDDYDYSELAAEFMNAPGGKPVEEPVLVVDLREKKKDNLQGKNALEDILSEEELLRSIGIDGADNKADRVLLEVGTAEDADKMVEEILLWDNDQVALRLSAKGSSKYMIKRLAFEGGYRVIELGKPTMKDYEEYARSFVEFYGFALEEGVDLRRMLKELKTYRGALMSEKDIYIHLSRCFETMENGKDKRLLPEDVAVSYYGTEKSSEEEWNRVIGLEDVKSNLKRMLAARKALEEQGEGLHRNMVMAGPPGVGKSMMARLFAKALAEHGLTNGRFLDVSRSDIIGKFVGHTAPKVREAFEKAAGGVLFVDEAAFLTGDDNFVREAVIEFVRFMELYPETVVIFASYPKEVDALLHCDSGFASRIGKVILFPGYDNEELYRIMEKMAEDFRFTLEDGCREVVAELMDELKEDETFGNAREVRRLFETAIEEYGLEECTDRVITAEHVRRAVEQRKSMDISEKADKFACSGRRIGF